MTDGATDQFTDDMRNALMIIAGARLQGYKMKMIHTGSITTFIECKKVKGIWTPLKHARRLMRGVIDKLEEQGFVELKADGSHILIEQTEKRT